MEIRETKLEGCVLCVPRIHQDGRGYFLETYRKSWFEQLPDYSKEFIQDNQSFSHYGTIRGLHLQTTEHAQAKLVRVVLGKVLDVAVDLRQGSPTYGQHISAELSAENNHQLWIPKGFAHGFSVLSETAVVTYKCDAYYNKTAEAGIYPLDETLAIDWQVPEERQIISEKDKELPSFIELRT